MIVQRLRAIQNTHGYLPDAELRALAREAGVPLYRVEEVSTFFPAFRLERDKPADVEVRVCRDMTCHRRGAAALLAPDGLPAVAAKVSGETGKSVRVEGVSCLGRCDRGPAVWVERHRPPMPDGEHAWVYAGRAPADLAAIVRRVAAGERPEPDTDTAYPPHTNASRPYSLPVVDLGEPPDHPPPSVAGWEIDVYARSGWPRDYRIVRAFAEGLVAARRRVVPRPPKKDGREIDGKDLDEYVRTAHPKLWELKLSNLLGMGGAGMPAYQKWLDVWRQRGDFEADEAADDRPGKFAKYIVANGDESEPGTFKDRELMLRTPHLLVEGIILAGLMTGASAGYLYVRHEYPEQIHALREEIARAAAVGACGPDVFGLGRPYPVEVYESPGGYICGEQSALLEAMEDRRAQPRNRPPELGTNGLRDRPTVVNNVETLAWAPYVLARGGDAYAAGGWLGPDGGGIGFAGRRLFSVSGDLRRPGVYEVPVGLPLRALVTDPEYCSGVTGELLAVAPSGPSGGLLPARLPVKVPANPDDHAKWLADGLARFRTEPERQAMRWFAGEYLKPGTTDLDVLSLPLDLSFFRNIHGLLRLPVEPMLGAGIGVYAAGPGADPLDLAVNFTRFYRNESCGKCVPCRLGSQKLVQIGDGLLKARPAGPALAAVKADVLEITRVLQQTSICGLGYVAPIPLATALAYFSPRAGG